MTDTYLAHHGVKGMKWGVRRKSSSGGTSGMSRKEKKALSKANKLQYKAQKKAAMDKYKKAIEPGKKASHEIHDAHMAEKRRIKGSTDLQKAIVNVATKKGSTANKIANSVVNSVAEGRYDYNRSKTQSKVNDWGAKYGKALNTSIDNMYIDRRKAKTLYQANKNAIASGDSKAVKIGKKYLS